MTSVPPSISAALDFAAAPFFDLQPIAPSCLPELQALTLFHSCK
jgi:hypothetical protein